jgi:hypothetical protein
MENFTIQSSFTNAQSSIKKIRFRNQSFLQTEIIFINNYDYPL